MALLSPLALLWLGSVPVLIWLWRYATSRQQTRIPSLVPFEHLLRRPPTRRTRLVINWLFWLQLAALVLLALALAEPMLMGQPTRTILVLVDTSASTAAGPRHASPLQQAKRALRARLSRRVRAERVLLVATAPVRLLTPEPTGDVIQLRHLIDALEAADLSGNVSLARRIGQAAIGTAVDETLVVTDEPTPLPAQKIERQAGSGLEDARIVFRSFGKPLPNIAIVGVEMYEPLCLPVLSAPQRDTTHTGPSASREPESSARLVVLVENFADVEQPVTVSVRADGRVLAQQIQRVGPGRRAPVTFEVPGASSEVLEVTLAAKRNALRVDDRVWLPVRGVEAIPVVVASESPAFVSTVGRWLDACPRIVWRQSSTADGTARAADILITDSISEATAWPSSVMVFAPHRHSSSRWLAHWFAVVHPLTEYLDVLEPVVSALEPVPTVVQGSEVVIWAVVKGQKIPLVSTASQAGRRLVSISLDPTETPTASPLVLVVLNSLRWLTGSRSLVTTGESLSVGPFEAGSVRVQRPDGLTELRAHDGGVFRYEATDRAGRYRFLHAHARIERTVNFLDPVESDTLHPVSTWRTDDAPTAAGGATKAPRQSVVNWVVTAIVVIMLMEWVLYCRKGRAGMAR